MADFIASAQRTIQMEADAVQLLSSRIDSSFVTACETILSCQGRVIVTGMGKSGHIGSKIAATLASTGTPAFFVHPGEASHGDLGMITKADIVIAISNSGNTSEIVTLIPLITCTRCTGNRKRNSSYLHGVRVMLRAGLAFRSCELVS